MAATDSLSPEPGGTLPRRQQYRPDIDGLRAVAVIAVVAFHVSPGRAVSGFAGVDIFFVISGFLISRIILNETREGRFALVRFYERRIRRIFPALVTVLSFSFLAAWIFFTPSDFARFGRELAGSAAFVPNFIIWNEGGYFNDPLSQPLIHLWSLGVEEQFYLVWPLLLVVACRRRSGPLILVLLLALASFTANIALSATDPRAAFLLPVPRVWELLIGAGAALLPSSPRSGGLAGILSACGALLLGLGFVWIHPELPFPSWPALLPTVGTFLLIAAGERAWLNRAILADRRLVAVGLVSYPWYLWHWALISLGHVAAYDDLGGSGRLMLALLALVLAVGTFRYIERPIRAGRAVNTYFLLLAMACLFVAGLLVDWSNGAPQRAIPEGERREFISSYRAYRYPGNFAICSISERTVLRSSLSPACARPGPRGTWMIWGDSHGRMLVPGLVPRIRQGLSLAQVTTPACPPAIDPWDAGSSRLLSCQRSNELAVELVSRIRPQILMLVQQDGHDRRDWEAMARQLRAAGAGQIVLLGPSPHWRVRLPSLASRDWPNIPEFVGDSLRTDLLDMDRRLKRRFQSSSDLIYISLTDALCVERACRAKVPGGAPNELMSFDYAHLSAGGSDYVARTILMPRLEALVAGAASARQSPDK